MEESLKYREQNYFNENDVFVFSTVYGILKTKVHFEKGYWWTNKKDGWQQYKCTSVKCYKLK